MATFPIHHRHRQEQSARDKIQRELHEDDTHHNDQHHTTQAGGDHRYRIPTIGLNPGAIPGTNPGTT